MGLAQWVNDYRWAMNVMRARAYRRTLSFAQREHFDMAIRPGVGPRSTRIDYPDALYHITIDDLVRAIRVAGPPEKIPGRKQ